MGRWVNGDPIAESGGLNLFVFILNNPVMFIDDLGLWPSWLWTDHQDMIDRAFEELTDIDCLQNPDIRDAVIDNLKWANVGMDFSNNYNQSNYELLPLHYNRRVFQDQEKAVKKYKAFIKDQKGKIDEALKNNTQGDCEVALKELGKLSHSIQDYYGHGVSKKYGKMIPRRKRRRHGGARYGVGRMSGTPSNPTMEPSSYYFLGVFGNHGFILFPEPGYRAPDTEKRKKASVTATVNLFRPYLEKWCEKCVVCPIVNPIKKKNGNRNLPSEDDYDKDF